MARRSRTNIQETPEAIDAPEATDHDRDDRSTDPDAAGERGAVVTADLEPVAGSSFAGLDSDSAPASAAPAKPPRGWTDPVVLVLVAVAIAGFAFAAGRVTKESGPKSLQEAQAMVQAGTLPATTGGASGTAGAGAAGARGQNGNGGAGGFTPPAGAGNFTPPAGGNFTPPAGMGAPPAG